MTPSFEQLYKATWLWLPFLVLFLVQGLHCSPKAKPVLFKIGWYYIVVAVGLHLLVPTAHLALRTLLFDLATRLFLSLQAAELLLISWSPRPAISMLGIFGGQKLVASKKDEDEDDEDEMSITPHAGLSAASIFYTVSALLYLGWLVLGLMFAFTLTPGL